MRSMANFKLQRGVVLLLLLLVVFATGSTLVLGVLNNRQDLQLQRNQQLYEELQRAKTNLLAYAAGSHLFYANTRGPGFFPCPDTDNNGLPQTTCNPTSNRPLIGRLPTHFSDTGVNMEFNSYYEGVDQQFWLAVGSRFIYHSSTSGNRRANSRTSTTGAYRLSLDGTANYVALIIAPGEALTTPAQNRAANRLLQSNYLESQQAPANYFTFFSSATSPATTNDMIVGITLDEFIRAVGPTVAHEIKRRLDANGTYPTSNGTNPSQTNFRALFPNNSGTYNWFRNGSTNGERWPWDTTYRYVSANSASLVFSGCAGIIFQLAGTGITRAGNTC